MRKACLEKVYELAKRDERVAFIGSDLGPGTLGEFERDFPDRFYMEGVNEAAITGLAAGLALEGHVPYFNTLATFLTRRSFEQNVLDLGLHNLPVRLIGNGGGLVYAPLGPTHLAVDDIAIMRTIPRMTVLVPADAGEMRRAMDATLDHNGPIYIRVAKGDDPVVTPAGGRFEIGKGYLLREGGDVLLVTTGITLGLALEAHARLRERGVAAGVLHLPTVKPFDADGLLAAARGTKGVITIEEGTLVGGLGSAVAEVLAEADLGAPPRLRRLGIPDVFPDKYGSQASLMRRYGITAEAAVEAALRTLGRTQETG